MKAPNRNQSNMYKVVLYIKGIFTDEPDVERYRLYEIVDGQKVELLSRLKEMEIRLFYVR